MTEKPKYFLHDSAYADAGAEIGEDSKIWHFSHIMQGSRLGQKCSLGQNVQRTVSPSVRDPSESSSVLGGRARAKHAGQSPALLSRALTLECTPVHRNL